MQKKNGTQYAPFSASLFDSVAAAQHRISGDSDTAIDCIPRYKRTAHNLLFGVTPFPTKCNRLAERLIILDTNAITLLCLFCHIIHHRAECVNSLSAKYLRKRVEHGIIIIVNHFMRSGYVSLWYERFVVKIRPKVRECFDELVKLRRDLHKIPEYSFDTFETYQYVMTYLSTLKPDRLTPCAGTGIKAVFLADNAQKTIAIRADMDGLRVPEKTGLDYASMHENMMHACGHDGHMAIALVCAKLISEAKKRLKYNYVFLFQPAEETVGGARPMIEQGALSDPQVDEIYGIHLWPDVPLGLVGMKQGPIMAQMCDFNIDIVGKSAHGAKPQAGTDALVAAAHLISAAQTIVSRNIDPYETAVLTIGRMEAGQTRNVICEKAHLEGTIRGFEPYVMDTVKRRLREMLDGLCVMYGVTYTYEEPMGYPAVSNDGALYERAQKCFQAEEEMLVVPYMMAEDFSNYQQEIPGLYSFIGIGEGGNTRPLHSSDFEFNEQALLNGVEYFLRVTDFE